MNCANRDSESMWQLFSPLLFFNKDTITAVLYSAINMTDMEGIHVSLTLPVPNIYRESRL